MKDQEIIKLSGTLKILFIYNVLYRKRTKNIWNKKALFTGPLLQRVTALYEWWYFKINVLELTHLATQR